MLLVNLIKSTYRFSSYQKKEKRKRTSYRKQKMTKLEEQTDGYTVTGGAFARG